MPRCAGIRLWPQLGRQHTPRPEATSLHLITVNSALRMAEARAGGVEKLFDRYPGGHESHRVTDQGFTGEIGRFDMNCG